MGIAIYQNALPAPYGTLSLEPAAEVVAYVRATQLANFSSEVASKWVPDIASGLARCRSGRNDVVVLLQGHTENVTSTTFANLVAGTRIHGLGRGSNRPNLRWTATGSQLALNKADVVLTNCILRLEGAVVAKAIAVTAADCAIAGCDIDTGSVASTNLATIGIEIGAGANRFEFRNNFVHSVADSGSTSVIKVAGVCEGAMICDNKIYAAVATAATIGVIDITAAATGLEIGNNIIQNRLAASQVGISVTGAVACTGIAYNNYIATEAGTPVSDGILLNAASLLRFFQNFTTDTKNVSGLLSPTVVT